MNKSKLYAILMFVCIAVMVVMVYVNYTPGSFEKVFSSNSYYTPITSDRSTINEQGYWLAGSGKKEKLNCKVTEPPVQNVTYFGWDQNKYGCKNWLFPIGYPESDGNGRSITLYDKVWDTGVTDDSGAVIEPLWKFLFPGTETVPSALNSDSHGMQCTFIPADSYWPIVAPFGFKFMNLNTSSGETCIIQSNDDRIRITCSDIANWYCAGDYPLDKYYDETLDGEASLTEEIANWENHKQNHDMILGNGKNSKCFGGQAGGIIAYATNETKIIIEYQTNPGSNMWSPISIKQFIMGE